MTAVAGLGLWGQSFPLKPAKKGPPKAQIVSVRKIWDKAPHNAFTDLIRFRERWYCAFREGEKHVSLDGAIRVLSSTDAVQWDTSGLLTYPVADLRDPKLAITADQRLMLTTAGAMHPPSELRHKTLVWFSQDGRHWTSAEMIGDPDIWLWRVSWHNGKAYGMGYSTTQERFLRAYISNDGREFDTWNPKVHADGYPNETSIVFLPDDTALCLLRRDGDQPTAQLGRSRPPYRGWVWRDLGVRIGGPNMIRLDDGRIVAAVRLYDGRPRTSLAWLDPERPELTEFLALPSGGDTSYAGLVFHDDLLYVSYYSSHEGKSSIYLAQVKLPGF
jgi:hypothetical protein